MQPGLEPRTICLQQIHVPYCDSGLSSRNEEGFPGGAVVENLPASAGDTGSSAGPGKSRRQEEKASGKAAGDLN